MRKWIGLFSQTGSELYNVSNTLGIYPDAVVTNKQTAEGINKNLLTITAFRSQKLNEEIWYIVPVKPTVDQYEEIFSKFDNPLITLHGYFRIIPKEICEKYEIYNLHPGLITKYPSLKGFNPQERAFKGGYKTAGCVIHQVIPEVDSGEILLTEETSIENESLDGVYSKLHSLASDMWVRFLEKKLK